MMWPLLLTVAVIVHADGSGEYPTIQAAVDAIADGDVVELADGIFIGPGNVDVHIDGRSITIPSSAHPSTATGAETRST